MRKPTVNFDVFETVFDIAWGRQLRFADGMKHNVTCLEGSLAVTSADSPQAVILQPGDSYRCDGCGVVMVHALSDGRLRLLTPAGDPACGPGEPKTRSALSELLRRLRR